MEQFGGKVCGGQKAIEDCPTAQYVLHDFEHRTNRKTGKLIRHKPVGDLINSRALLSYQQRCRHCGKVCLPALLPDNSVQLLYTDQFRGDEPAVSAMIEQQ